MGRSATISSADSRTVYIHQLRGLIRRGRELSDGLAVQGTPASGRDSEAEAHDNGVVPEMLQAATRIWQQDCAALIQQLSGGSKAHWLSLAHSEAYLVPGRSPRSSIPLGEIAQRLMDVLERAVGALESNAPPSNAREPNSASRRFEFVHEVSLRPVLEQAYADSRTALQGRDFVRSFALSCSILEAIITDALSAVKAGAAEAALTRSGLSDRVAAAELAGLIKGGCARLPPAAYHYRLLTDERGELVAGAMVSERDARLVSQVLHVVIRDLDPGR